VRFFAEVHTFSSNTLVTTLLTITKSFYFISALTAFGLIFAIAFFIREERGVLTSEALRVKKLGHLATFVTLVTVLGGVFTELANLLGGSLLDAFDSTTIKSFLSQTTIGRDYLFQFITGFAVIVILQRAKKIGAMYWALALSLIGLLAPVFQQSI